ncbi:metallopeptidase family protein [Jonesia quinghaiensis]|uniref:metallopeptidase family protein n=1 Tax=Jonesia quinghaiensis TaxID=262806 RepID=UPI001FDEA479|nr:metallopeptidase family protein [Jonesia quinghaiensis]
MSSTLELLCTNGWTGMKDPTSRDHATFDAASRPPSSLPDREIGAEHILHGLATLDPASVRPSKRDRRGRGLRGLMFPPVHPAYRTRRERFDECVIRYVGTLKPRWGKQLSGMEFAVEDVPPSDPSPWEAHGIPMGRYFAPISGQPGRIVVYRRPVEARADDHNDLESIIRDVIIEQIAYVLSKDPSEIDPDYDPDE